MSRFTEPALLVPFHVDMLAMGLQPSLPGFQWTRLSPDYARLKTEFYLGPDLMKDPFDQAAALETGVHLHFHLPRAFLQGRQREKSSLTFPVIPNRWLVQRVAIEEGQSKASHQAWLIRSDLKDSEAGVAWPILVDNTLSVSRIGAAEALSAPLGDEDQPTDLKLTAIGVGKAGVETQVADPLFSAHYLASRSILGFHDTLTDIPDKARLGYLVTGWFSKATDDPLWDATKTQETRLKDFEEWLEQRKWTCNAPEGQPLPRRILCHGFVHGLEWVSPDKNPDKNYFDPELFSPLGTPSIGIATGQTPAEALSALLQDGELEQDLLTALQDGLLVSGSTIAKLRSDLHSHRFDAAPGGSVFVLSPETDAADLGKSGTPQALSPTPTDLPEELANKLDRLNSHQAACDAATRTLEDCRLQLHAVWLLLTSERQAATSAAKINALEERLNTVRTQFAEATEKSAEAIARRNEVHTPGPTSESWAAADPGATVRYRLTSTPAPAFHIAREPAVALAGRALTRQHTAERSGSLFCRHQTQMTTGVIVPVAGGRPITVSGEKLVNDVLGATPGSVDGLHLSLLGEAFLLDRDNAERIARLAGAPNLASRLRENEFWATEGNLVGKLPDSISQFVHSGTNPWIPLMLVWEVEWWPERQAADTPTSTRLPPDAVCKHWALGDDGLLQRKAKLAEADLGNVHRIRGQSLLLSGAADTLRDRLAVNESLDLLRDLNNRPMTSQSLAGFNQALLARRLAMLLPPLDYDRWADEGNFRFDRILDDFGNDGAPFRLWPEVSGPFLPLRAGRLRFSRLHIVDAFGQTISCDTDTVRVTRSCRGSSSDEIRLPPRLVQPARLQIDWGEPICGWIVANHLDQSLTVHAADGMAIGILQIRLNQLGATSDRAAFYWAGVPGSGSETPDAITDRDMRAFCKWVLGLGPDAGAMLFALIGEQIDASDQRTPDEDPLLSIVIGHPLALVRVSLRLELAGPPVHRPDRQDSRGVEHVLWPIRLGDRRANNDGLVGFFRPVPGGDPLDKGEVAEARMDKAETDRRVAEFFPAWGQPLGRMSDKLSESFKEQTNLVIDAVQPLRLVLLMDPLAPVHATSGAMPISTFELPPRLSSGSRRAREVFFQTAPVLGFGEQPEMPRPSDDYGEWSWFWRPAVTDGWRAADHLVEAAERGGFDDRRPSIAEGWLKLRIEPIKGFSFWVQDTDKPVAPGSKPRLAWSQQGAKRLELSILRPNPRQVEVWDKPPFPNTYVVEMQEDTTFQLKASADGIERSLELTVRVKT